MEKSNNKHVPNMRGKWNTTASILTRNSLNERPSFDNIQKISFPSEIEQKDQFLIINEATTTRIGVLNYLNNTWTITIADDDDNGTSVLVPRCPGNYDVWVGSYTESGFDDIPEQAQVVGTVKLKRE